MHKYLYLTEVEWVDTWINGGCVPVSLASSYLSIERDGIMTPDENLIHESPVPIPSLENHGFHVNNCHNITFKGCTGDGFNIPDIIDANYYSEDGLVLSFCNTFDICIAKKLKKKACVRILNIKKLKKNIDRQLGCKGVMKSCEYTSTHNRNHFLKDEADAWQDEYRIFWKTTIEKQVNIPAGTAELVKAIK